MPTVPLFEHDTCHRCCGTGKYSFNMVHGTRCYGCGGGGYKLTKRGAAAQAYLRELRMVPVQCVRPGDRVELMIVSPYVTKTILHRVSEVNITGERVELVFHHSSGTHIDQNRRGALIRKAVSNLEAEQRRQLALAYQEHLTKTGTFRKGA